MSKFVYVVDDEAAVRDSLRTLIGTRGNLLIQAFASGEAFLDVLADRESGVVLLDMHMPGPSGIDVLRALADAPQRFAAVIITGQGNVPLAVQALRLGAIDFLEKPYRPEALFDALDRAFADLDQSADHDRVRAISRSKLQSLSEREREVLMLLIDGASNKLVADRLGIALRTAELHRANLMTKLGAPNLSALFHLALVAGLFEERRPAAFT